MFNLDLSQNPFILLWLIYLIFLGVVFCFNIFALIIKKCILWQVRQLERNKRL